MDNREMLAQTETLKSSLEAVRKGVVAIEGKANLISDTIDECLIVIEREMANLQKAREREARREALVLILGAIELIKSLQNIFC